MSRLLGYFCIPFYRRSARLVERSYAGKKFKAWESGVLRMGNSAKEYLYKNLYLLARFFDLKNSPLTTKKTYN